jgi:hypothetical protein
VPVPRFEELIRELARFQRWLNDANRGRPVYSTLGRNARDAIVRLLEDPAVRAELDKRISEARGRLEARRGDNNQQSLAECGKSISAPSPLKAPVSLSELVQEILDADGASNGIRNSADLVEAIKDTYSHITSELPEARKMARKPKRAQKRKLIVGGLLLTLGIGLLANGRRFGEIPCVCEFALRLIETGITMVLSAKRQEG